MLAKGGKVNTLYMIEAKIKTEDVNVAAKDSVIETWHKRLGHVGEKRLETLSKKKRFLPSFADASLKTYVHC